MPAAVTVRTAFSDLIFCADEIPLLTAEATLPCWKSRHSSRFERYYRACAAVFTNDCRCRLFPQAQALYREALETACPLPQWHAQLRTVLTFQTADAVSLYTETSVSGCQTRNLFRRADTWDLRRGLPLQLQEFFPPHAAWRKLLLQTAAQQIEKALAQGIALYDPDWHKKLRRRFDPRRFYLTEEGLCFFYPLHSIAPAIEGLPTFLLPYNEQTGPFRPQ